VEEASALLRPDEQAIVDLFAIFKKLVDLATLQVNPLSYDRKLAVILGLSLKKSILAGTLNLALGGIFLGGDS